MAQSRKSRITWVVCLVVIIALGILSRTVHTGVSVLDKYLGDALYAAMVYAILRLFTSSPRVVLWASVIMTAIEFFQLTMIPAHLLHNSHWMVRIAARLMGTQFSIRDLLAYAVGIGCVYWLDVA